MFCTIEAITADRHVASRGLFATAELLVCSKFAKNLLSAGLRPDPLGELTALSVSLASHVSTHLLIHLSAHLCYHHHSHHPSLIHSFTPGSKPTFSTNPSHLRLLLPTGLPSRQRDWTGPIMLIVLFLVWHFFIFCLFRVVDCWLPVSF